MNRPYQQKALDGSVAKWKAGIYRQLHVMATGTGKTHCFAQLPKIFQPYLPGKMLVLAHREELIDQAIAKIQAENPGKRIDKEKAEHVADPVNADIVVASVASIGNRLMKYDWSLFDKFVIDEAHHSTADSYMRILNDARLGKRYSLETEVNTARIHFKLFLELSKSRNLKSVSRIKRKLLDHHLGRATTGDDFLLQKVEDLIRGFFKFPDVEELLKFPQDVLPDFLESGSFEIGHELGVPARPRTDAVWVTPEAVVIGDWKCGRQSSSHASQALTYDIYVRAKLGLPSTEKVEVRFYYLADGSVVSHEFSDEDRHERMWQIGEQFETLKSYSEDSKINLASIGRFSARITKACQECPFQTLCPEFLKTQGSAQPKPLEVA